MLRTLRKSQLDQNLFLELFNEREKASDGIYLKSFGSVKILLCIMRQGSDAFTTSVTALDRFDAVVNVCTALFSISVWSESVATNAVVEDNGDQY